MAEPFVERAPGFKGAHLAHVLAPHRGTRVSRVTIAFSKVVRVQRPHPQDVTITGWDILLESRVAPNTSSENLVDRVERFMWLFSRSPDFPDLNGQYRVGRDFVIEILREDGGSVGGSWFQLRCENNDCPSQDIGWHNAECAGSGFQGHAAMVPSGNNSAWGLGVDADYRLQGLATNAYRLALTYAAARGWYIVPATHVHDHGQDVWRKLLREFEYPAHLRHHIAHLL